jgi:hypothetical protein
VSARSDNKIVIKCNTAVRVSTRVTAEHALLGSNSKQGVLWAPELRHFTFHTCIIRTASPLCHYVPPVFILSFLVPLFSRLYVIHSFFLLPFLSFYGDGPRSRRYGRTAAWRLIVQPNEDD